jgi:hypothetical protein
MNSSQGDHREFVQHVEKLECDRCRKRWEVGWVETLEGSSVEHALTCDCGRVMKVVQVAEDDSPLMILQHSHGKTVVACLPAFIAGAFFPVISDAVILTAYVISWIACAATFVNEYNRSASALGGIAIWAIAIVSGAAAVGAMAAHALWWWHSG